MLHNEIDVKTILDNLAEQPPIKINESIKDNIEKIIKICEEKYFHRYAHGNAAMNRDILLDPEIAKLLTLDVIYYICANAKVVFDTENVELNLETSVPWTGPISLLDVLRYGFEDVLGLKYMLNDLIKYNPDAYAKQKSNFEEHTLDIIINIYQAANLQPLSRDTLKQKMSIDFNTMQLELLFDDIATKVKILKEKNLDDELLTIKVHHNPLDPEDNGSNKARTDILIGFQRLCTVLGYSFPLIHVSLEEFGNKFLQSPQVIFDKLIKNSLLDRVHILATLVKADIVANSLPIPWTYYDFFKFIVKKITTHPQLYPSEIVEQLYVRLKIVHKDIINRFGVDLEKIPAKPPMISLDPVETLPIIPLQAEHQPQVLHNISHLATSYLPGTSFYTDNTQFLFAVPPQMAVDATEMKAKHDNLKNIGWNLIEHINTTYALNLKPSAIFCRVSTYIRGNKDNSYLQPPKQVQFNFSTQEDANTFLTRLKKMGLKLGNKHLKNRQSKKAFYVQISPDSLYKIANQLHLAENVDVGLKRETQSYRKLPN